MKQSAKREQIILQMIRNRIGIPSFQEAHMILASKPEINTHLFFPEAPYAKQNIRESAFVYFNASFEKYGKNYVQ